MEEFDENGWAHIHHAAFNGYHKSVARFVKGRDDQLELLTEDGKQTTPLLLACISGKIETVKVLIDLGADLKATDRKMQGPVELAAVNNHTNMMEFFLDNCSELHVWKRLIKMLSGMGEEDSDSAAANTLAELTATEQDGYIEQFINESGIPALVNLLDGNVASEDAMEHTLTVMLNLVKNENARKELGNTCIPAIIRKAGSENRPLYVQASKLLALLAVELENKEKITKEGGIEVLAKLIRQCVDDEEVLRNCLTAVREVANSTAEIKATIGSNNDIMKGIGQLLADSKNKHTLAMAGRTISSIVLKNKVNQDIFVSEGGVPPLVDLVKQRSKECQIAAVEAMQALAEDNENNETILTEHGCVMILMRILKRTRATDLRRLTAGALWTIAGNKSTQQRSIANEIGVNLLIEFLSENLPESLHFVASEALGILAEGVHNKRNEIASANGVMPLVRLIGKSSTPMYIILSVFRTLRALCVCIGFRPHSQIQDTLSQNQAIKHLMKFLIQARQDLIKVEAAYTLGYVALGHHSNMKAILDHKDFSFVHILRLLYNENQDVQLLAGAALATFAYNCGTNQQHIAMAGGVHYHFFAKFLDSKDEWKIVHAAFQLVVLSRIIPDEVQALSSATGIKVLVKMLSSESESIQTITANFLGALAHTRAGIPAAIISIGTIPILGTMLISPYETVQAAAAIALAYLSHNGVGQRKILNICRHDPFLFKVLQFHIGKMKLSDEFIERWKHCKQIGLPPIMNKPNDVADGSKKPMAHHTLDQEGTFTVPSTNESPAGIPFSEVDRKVSASTRTEAMLKLPVA